MSLTFNPKTHGVCPVCSGTKRVPAGDYKWKNVVAGYDAETDTLLCTNCGAQYQNLTPTGIVRLNYQDQPCTHEYESSPTPYRCVTSYTCFHCTDSYTIDSSD